MHCQVEGNKDVHAWEPSSADDAQKYLVGLQRSRIQWNEREEGSQRVDDASKKLTLVAGKQVSRSYLPDR